MVTREQLAQIIPKNPYIDQWCDALNKLLPDYGIDTPQRVAAFLAQCATGEVNAAKGEEFSSRDNQVV